MAKRTKEKAASEQLPPLESSNWTLYEDALEEVYRYFGDADLAVRAIHETAPQKLVARIEPPFLSRSTPPAECLVEQRVLPPGTVEAVVQTRTVGTRKKLVDGWRDNLMFALDGEVRWGQLFVWDPAVKKILGGADVPVPKVELEPKTIVKSSGPFRDEWIQFAVEVVKLRRDFPRELRNQIAVRFEQMLIDAHDADHEKYSVPTHLWELVDKVFEFDDNPLPRPGDKKGKGGKLR